MILSREIEYDELEQKDENDKIGGWSVICSRHIFMFKMLHNKTSRSFITRQFVKTLNLNHFDKPMYNVINKTFKHSSKQRNK